MSFGLIVLVVALAIFAYGATQKRRTGEKMGKRKWAAPAAALGLVVMSVGSIVFEGMESIYIWMIGLGLFFIGFFVERIGDIKKEMNRTRDIEY
jgi:amino acid transporter